MIQNPMEYGVKDSVLTSSMAAMMGIPIPFINNGKILLELFRDNDEGSYLYTILESTFVNLK